MSFRIAQVNRLLQIQISQALPGLMAPGLLPTVNRVETSPDLRNARVWISVLPDDDAHQELLEELRPQLQQAVAEAVVLKNTPKLDLRYDQGPAAAVAVNELLDDV